MAFRFIGVPFAQPPTGDLRFQYAQPWNGTYANATQYGPACLQYEWFDGNDYGLNPWGNSEDCLFLNVYTPHIPASPPKNTSTLKPVMFWMYGGASTQGSAADSTFDGASLVSRGDVVLVTANYRLNIFGFLTLNDSTVPGNYHASDKIEALNWVQKYITAFGGDPNNVTIFGQSAGASSVIDLIQSPKAPGLFTGAIVQSSGNGHTVASSAAASQILPFVNELCSNATGTARLSCLQALPAETLLGLTKTNVTSWKAVIDNIYLDDVSIAQLAKGQQYLNKVKLLNGYMSDECQSLIGESLPPNVTSLEAGLEIVEKVGFVNANQAAVVLKSPLWTVSNSTKQSKCQSKWSFDDPYNATVNVATDAFITGPGVQLTRVGAASYSYERMWIYRMERGYALSYYNPWGLCSFPVGRPETPYYKCHSSDLYEVFGTYYLFDQPIRVDEDVYYTNAIQDMWASFARTGNPNVDKAYLRARGYHSTLEFFSDFVWPPFDVVSPKVASLQFPGPGVTTLPDQERLAVLTPFARDFSGPPIPSDPEA
ncbi:Carboxylesterase, type B [Pleurostoma richardsiae]|uniref:Carboxylic ester hydrolase n=1 Tax=Pleurostoma richardsiae TaxID=41990 RepID=A0AA38VX81_9PEZI|nr:Carboxylesterase, type B [Pleurostoma richardsiae]